MRGISQDCYPISNKNARKMYGIMYDCYSLSKKNGRKMSGISRDCYFPSTKTNPKCARYVTIGRDREGKTERERKNEHLLTAHHLNQFYRNQKLRAGVFPQNFYIDPFQCLPSNSIQTTYSVTGGSAEFHIDNDATSNPVAILRSHFSRFAKDI